MKTDWHYSNLPIVNKVAIIILDKYNQDRFCNIILVYCNLKIDINQYYTISSNSATYIPLYYILFFLTVI